jgi:hypothetical protein
VVVLKCHNECIQLSVQQIAIVHAEIVIGRNHHMNNTLHSRRQMKIIFVMRTFVLLIFLEEIIPMHCGHDIYSQRVVHLKLDYTVDMSFHITAIFSSKQLPMLFCTAKQQMHHPSLTFPLSGHVNFLSSPDNELRDMLVQKKSTSTHAFCVFASYLQNEKLIHHCVCNDVCDMQKKYYFLQKQLRHFSNSRCDDDRKNIILN